MMIPSRNPIFCMRARQLSIGLALVGLLLATGCGTTLPKRFADRGLAMGPGDVMVAGQSNRSLDHKINRRSVGGARFNLTENLDLLTSTLGLLYAFPSDEGWQWAVSGGLEGIELGTTSPYMKTTGDPRDVNHWEKSTKLRFGMGLTGKLVFAKDFSSVPYIRAHEILETAYGHLEPGGVVGHSLTYDLGEWVTFNFHLGVQTYRDWETDQWRTRVTVGEAGHDGGCPIPTVSLHLGDYFDLTGSFGWRWYDWAGEGETTYGVGFAWRGDL